MKIAVAIALYNGEKFIEKQLDSLRTQTRKPDYVVMCDDGSKDNTITIVEDYIKKYSLQESWQVHKNEKNLGYIKNFYHAISLCDADIVFLSDQDDIWVEDKIEKMSEVMLVKKDINLLSCKYGIIDTEGNEISSIMEKKAKGDESLLQIGVKDVMRAYRWPGMVMAIRKEFFCSILPYIENYKIPHDLAFILCAADQNSFYEYNYVGAFHRRHDNNLAREEHRVSKLLNLERKLKDISEYNQMLEVILNAKIPMHKKNMDAIKYKLFSQKRRENALIKRNMREIIMVYIKDFRSERMLRMMSFVCDIWLVAFGKYK